LWRGLTTVFIVLAVSIPLGSLIGFRMIITSSVPKGLWFVHTGRATRGNYVLTCLPQTVAIAGKQAGYLPPGFCPGKTLPVMKRVVAAAGDYVSVGNAGISVNGVVIAGSRRLSKDSRGRPVAGLVEATTYVVPHDAVWLLGDWFKSWDSRYYGAVPASLIIGVGVPLIVTPPGS